MARHSDSAHARRTATGIVRTLRDAGHVAFFAGGCVRDELLGLEPTDYDVATDATPDRIRSLFPRTADVGASFGVILVRQGHVTIEVATFRSEGPYTDRRRPDAVTFSDAKHDAQRRDFTINALFLDPLASSGGQAGVIDFVGGVEDLRSRLLRAVGDPDARLAEDHLRALRAVRLAARLGFTIDPATAAAIQRHAAELQGVSRERIGDELRRILVHPSRVTGVALLDDLGLTPQVLMDGGEGTNREVLGRLPPDVSFACALTAWATDRAGSAGAVGARVGTLRSALCLSNDESEAVRGIAAVADFILAGWSEAGVAGRKRAAAGRWFAEGMVLAAAIDAEVAASVNRDVEHLESDGIGVFPQAWVTGDDLVSLGFEPGPGFRRALESVYDAQLEGRVRSRAEALELARRLGV